MRFLHETSIRVHVHNSNILEAYVIRVRLNWHAHRALYNVNDVPPVDVVIVGDYQRVESVLKGIIRLGGCGGGGRCEG